ncbi:MULTISPECIES: TIGR01777 family oxidoreductase [unclassified Robiginitalea]|uniref:TIGR01777 family oxidoreductase n=1 Tax=Robiginitalea TaxID=252306 RepID=UPI00234ADBED|nr:MULTISPECIES: TIGR01777 family oxidoreductase [unclassified Robiginitalea]MDC6355293.1 TIGR01777 family oxidoreductase [Robiginitalea sp. PM2]MDC6375492.1 TIGR01777 family oxidoreductase [Robiginitalea sp. SP8]
MKVLITGATGLVGTAITRQCREAGVDVHYLTTRQEKIREEPGYRGFLWDPAQRTLDPRSFDGVQAVINLAGTSISQPWTPSNKRKIQQSRADSLDTLFRHMKTNGKGQVEYLVSASAIGIYGHSFTDYHMESSTHTGEGFLAETVRQWEDAARAFEALEMPCGMLRLGLVLADEGGALPQIARPVRFYAGAPLGSGRQWQSWIHLEDAAAMFLFAVHQQLEGVYNAVAPNPVTNAKLTRQVAEVLNKPIWLPRVPAAILKLLMGERAELVLGSQRVCADKIKMEGFTYTFANLRPALEDLL